MKKYVAFLAILLIGVPDARAVVVSEDRARALEVSQANGTVYHLVGICMAGQQACTQNRPAIESSIAMLESNVLSATSAARYRTALVKIDEGHGHYAKAKGSPGRERSRWVELGNSAMGIAKGLLREAARLFNDVFPRILQGEGWKNASKSRWTCTAQCDVVVFDPQPGVVYPAHVTGSASGHSKEDACREAKRVATQSTPRGSYPRHCKCICSKG